MAENKRLRVADRLEELFKANMPTEPDENGCLIWQGRFITGHTGRSYPVIAHPTTGTVYAHRFSHEYFIGPIPEKYDVDHVWNAGCRNSLCVAPDHLEAISHAENVRRGYAKNETCKTGRHERTPENRKTRLINGRERTVCKPCLNEGRRKSYAIKVGKPIRLSTNARVKWNVQ